VTLHAEEHSTLGGLYNVLALISGMAQPRSGGLFVPPHLRVHFVEQTPGVADDTLLANLRYGRMADVNTLPMSETEVWRVAQVRPVRAQVGPFGCSSG
jgi:hypothetical protein